MLNPLNQRTNAITCERCNNNRRVSSSRLKFHNPDPLALYTQLILTIVRYSTLKRDKFFTLPVKHWQFDRKASIPIEAVYLEGVESLIIGIQRAL